MRKRKIWYKCHRYKKIWRRPQQEITEVQRSHGPKSPSAREESPPLVDRSSRKSMLFALVDEKKTRAFPSGRAICPNCDKELLAKTGEIVTWHWSHFADHKNPARGPSPSGDGGIAVLQALKEGNTVD